MLEQATGFLTRAFRDAGHQCRYGLYVPNEYDPECVWPTILFLHGAGEAGRDGLLPTEYQLGSAIRRQASRYPGLVIFPQLPTFRPLWRTADVDYALRVLAEVRRHYCVDPQRIYVTGPSSGGRATWHALYRQPELFAAALVVCGMVRPRLPDGTRVADADPVVPDADGDPAQQLARVLRDIPIWTFHGDVDPVFPVSDTREVMAALGAAGAPVRYTELPGFGHDVWDVAYYSPEVADWLFAQARG